MSHQPSFTPSPPPLTPATTEQRALVPYSVDANRHRHQQSQSSHQTMHFQAPTFMNVFCEPGNYTVNTGFAPNMARNFGFGGAYGTTSTNRHYFPGAGQPVGQYGRGDFGSQSNRAGNAARMAYPPRSMDDLQNVSKEKKFRSSSSQ